MGPTEEKKKASNISRRRTAVAESIAYIKAYCVTPKQSKRECAYIYTEIEIHYVIQRAVRTCAFASNLALLLNCRWAKIPRRAYTFTSIEIDQYIYWTGCCSIYIVVSSRFIHLKKIECMLYTSPPIHIILLCNSFTSTFLCRFFIGKWRLRFFFM